VTDPGARGSPPRRRWAREGSSHEPRARGSSPHELGLTHRFVPRSGLVRATLLLLHGTGGDEHDLLPLGRHLTDGAALLSPRGAVLEQGMSRFFRRVAEGVFDQEDLAARTDELAAFVAAAAERYDLDPEHIIAVGFSNGANIAGSLMLRYPEVLRAAVLFAPMVPFEPVTLPDLSEVAVFIGAGGRDPISPPEESERLARILADAGAAVTLRWHDGGHQLDLPQVGEARRWLQTLLTVSTADPSRPLP
jgi:predicted esterase